MTDPEQQLMKTEQDSSVEILQISKFVNGLSVQKASTGPILPLNLMFQLLKMLTVLHFLGTELRM